MICLQKGTVWPIESTDGSDGTTTYEERMQASRIRRLSKIRQVAGPNHGR